jgi:hypothetical protein
MGQKMVLRFGQRGRPDGAGGAEGNAANLARRSKAERQPGRGTTGTEKDARKLCDKEKGAARKPDLALTWALIRALSSCCLDLLGADELRVISNRSCSCVWCSCAATGRWA